MKRLTAKQIKRLKAVAATPDDRIDFSDIPEITDFSGAVRGRLAKPETKAISLRLSQVDLGHARTLAEKKGLSYQTYLKSIIHEGLERERRAS